MLSFVSIGRQSFGIPGGRNRGIIHVRLEFIARKIAVKLIEGLRYKLRMMGVPVEDLCNALCDNELVVKNLTRPELRLKKKHSTSLLPTIALMRHRLRGPCGLLRKMARLTWRRFLQSSWRDRRFGICCREPHAGNWMAFWLV